MVEWKISFESLYSHRGFLFYFFPARANALPLSFAAATATPAAVPAAAVITTAQVEVEVASRRSLPRAVEVLLSPPY